MSRYALTILGKNKNFAQLFLFFTIPLAIQRATDYGWRGRNKHTFVIDDSQRGLAAAIGARVVPIGITTGIYSRQQLSETGTEHIVDNFREIPGLIERLCNEF